MKRLTPDQMDALFIAGAGVLCLVWLWTMGFIA